MTSKGNNLGKVAQSEEVKRQAAEDKGLSGQDDSEQQQLVDMTVTEDNPIPINEQTIVPTDENLAVPMETAMSLINNSLSGAITQANQSQSLQLPAEIQGTSIVAPIEVKGGNFDRVNIGPATEYKNVGIATANFAGAHFGPTYTSVVYKIVDSGNENEQSQAVCEKHGESCRKLTDSICFFPDKKLSTARRSAVYEGVESRELLSDLPLAIKLIEYNEKNRREVENLAKLCPHTNVVSMHQAAVCTQKLTKYICIAMERCDTANLEIYIENRKMINLPFNVKETFCHCEQIIRAIWHIHDNEILHRDLKPSSILFSLSRKFLKICDFGLSKELKHGRSVTCQSMLKLGTDGYRAPETYNDDSITKMADIFSLALVLHHLMSYGFHPFGLDPDEWNFNIKKGQNLDLSHLRAPFRDVMSNLLEQMLKLKPEVRPNIKEVHEEFMQLDWISPLMKNLVEIWSGTIKNDTGEDVFPCQFCCSPTMKEVLKMDGTEWKFQMETKKFLNLGGLKKVTEEEPAGYIVTSASSKVKKLIQKVVKNKLMLWITLSKEGEKEKVLILLCYPDYPELFGFFFPSLDSMSSVIGKLLAKQQKKGFKARPEQRLSKGRAIPSTIDPKQYVAQLEEFSHMVEDYDKFTGEARGSTDEDYLRGETSASIKSQPRRAVMANTEFIPWWIISGN